MGLPSLELDPRLIELVNSVPTAIRVLELPPDNSTWIVALTTGGLSIFAALLGAILGAWVSTRQTRRAMKEQFLDQTRQRHRESYYLLVSTTVDAINVIAGIEKHLKEELEGLEFSNLETGNWELIRQRTWSIAPAANLPPRCAALLVEFRDKWPLASIGNLISGAQSLEGNLAKFESLRDQLEDELDDPSISSGFSPDYHRHFSVSAEEHPKAFRLAKTLGALSLQIRRYLPRYSADVETAIETLKGLADRHWKAWGFESVSEAKIIISRIEK